MSQLLELGVHESELLDALDDFANGKEEQARKHAISLIQRLDSEELLHFLLLLRSWTTDKKAVLSTTHLGIGCNLEQPLVAPEEGAEDKAQPDANSSCRCASPQQLTTQDKTVDFNVSKAADGFITPRLGDIHESDQSINQPPSGSAADLQQPVVSNRLLAQLQQHERVGRDMGSLELMGQSVAVGQSVAGLHLLQASHMELLPSSYGEQQIGVVTPALHSSAASYGGEIKPLIHSQLPDIESPTASLRISSSNKNADNLLTAGQPGWSSTASDNSASFKKRSETVVAGDKQLSVITARPTSAVGLQSPQPATAVTSAPLPGMYVTEPHAGSLFGISGGDEPVSAAPAPGSIPSRGSDLRQSAMTGLQSFQLQLPTESEYEDTASEIALSDVVTPTAAAVMAKSAPLHSPASSCCTSASLRVARSALPSFSHNSSSYSANKLRTPEQSKQQQQQQLTAIATTGASKSKGIRGMFGAIRRSLTGKQIKAETAASTPAASKGAGGTRSEISTTSTAGTGAKGNAGTGKVSPAGSLVQSRLPSFTETERVRQAIAASSNSRHGGKHTPGSTGSSRTQPKVTSTSYRPPGSANSTASGRSTAGPAIIATKSPLGKGPAVAAAKSPAVGAAAVASSEAMSRTTFIRTPAATPSPTPSKSAVPVTPSATPKAGARTVSSPAGSAGLAWLSQHSKQRTEQDGAAGLRTAPVSPCNSRPGSVASVRSVASAAPQVGTPSRIGAGAAGAAAGAAGGQIPGFSATRIMLDGKQQQQRTALNNSARSGASAASKASCMRRVSTPGDAFTAAGANGIGASRLPSFSNHSSRPGQQHIQAASPASAATPSRAAAAAVRRGSNRVGAGAAAAAAGPGSELRRSRSCGSLAEMLKQGTAEAHHDVSEVRRMWQQRAAEHRQQQLQLQKTQQELFSKGKERLALRQFNQFGGSPATAAIAHPAGSAGVSRINNGISSNSRIPALGSRMPLISGTTAASSAAPIKLEEPQMCDSPPTSPMRLSSRRSSRNSDSTSAASDADVTAPPATGTVPLVAAPAVGASFVPGLKMKGLLQRMDDELHKLEPELPADVHSAPLAATAVPAGGHTHDHQMQGTHSFSRVAQQQHALEHQQDAISRQLFN